MFISSLAYTAAGAVVKKLFESGASSITQALKERFHGNEELLKLKDELEQRCRMLCLPVDACSHRVAMGNTALEEALTVSLAVLQEVENFRQELVHQDIARAQEASPDAGLKPAAEMARQLRALIAKLDGVLPYLTLAVASVGLLAADPGLSPSRLMEASWQLRSRPDAGQDVFSLPQAVWHEERQLTAAGPAMSEVFPLCALSVRRVTAAAPAPAAAQGRQPAPTAAAAAEQQYGGQYDYELAVGQSFEDGRHHNDDEAPGSAVLRVSDILALEWGTTQSLTGIGNDHRPALILLARRRPGPETGALAVTGEASPAGAATPQGLPSSGRGARRGGRRAGPLRGDEATPASRLGVGGGAVLRRYAVQVHCSASSSGAGGESPGSSGSDDDDEGRSRSGSEAAASAAGQPDGAAAPGELPGREWTLLGDLDSVLRLCLLEWRQQAPHFLVEDEQLRMAFAAGPGAVGGARPPAALAGTAARHGGGSASQRSSVRPGSSRARHATSPSRDAEGVDSIATQLHRTRLSAADGTPPRRTGRAGFGSPVQ